MFMNILKIIGTYSIAFVLFVASGLSCSQADSFLSAVHSQHRFTLGIPMPDRDVLTCQLLWCTNLSLDTPHQLFMRTPATAIRYTGGVYFCLSFGEMESAVIDVSSGKIVSWTHD